MTQCVIELNDAAISLYRPERELVVSPSCAVVSGDQLKVGESAYREARLRPHLVQTQFWTRLSMDPLPQPGHRARNFADLAYAHLVHLWESGGESDGDVILAVPSTFSREQLALLLGIARQCPFNPVGLVDSAVAAAADLARPGPVFHVDLQLQRTVMTLMRADAALERESIEEIEAVGMATLRSAWIGLIADIFIMETRFDPLHSAESEQALYNQLSTWLLALRDASDVAVEIETSGVRRHISLARARLIEHVQSRYDTLVRELTRLVSAAGGATVLISHRVNLAPGLAEALATIAGAEVSVLEADAAPRGALARTQEIQSSGDALAFVTRVTASEVHRPADFVPNAPEPTKRPRATHVLLQHTAYALSTGTLSLGGSAGVIPGLDCNARLQHDTEATRVVEDGGNLRVNDKPVGVNQELFAGDRIQSDSHECLLISVEEDHGS